MNRNKRLIMLSLDAVSSDDLTSLKQFPNFSALLERSTLVSNVSSVFISNTYPAHTSIITGMHPEKHGVIENVFLSPQRKVPKWRISSADIKVPALYDKAAEKGLKTCSILYPVTGGANITWNIPEVAGKMDIINRAFSLLSLGSTGFIISSLMRFGRQFKGMHQPALDDFTMTIAADAVVRYKPDLLMLHLIDADEQKHKFGPSSEQAYAALKRHDERIGKIIDALKRAGTYDETGIIVFSDHGCLPVHTSVDPNEALREAGLIQEKGGKLIGYDAYFHNAGGTAFLRLYNQDKKDEAGCLAEKLLAKPYISRLLTDEEMRISGMGREYMLGFEAAGGYSFGEKESGQHGYGLKREGYYPFYMAVGENIPQGKELSGGCITDICPLAADMLGIPKWEMDGVNRIF